MNRIYIAKIIQFFQTFAIFRKNYLVCRGSPYSSVSKATFTNEHEVVHREYSKFTIDPTDW